jgi:CubicO group peptidase (beta-lactamase class C family)
MRRKTRVTVIVASLLAGLLWKPLPQASRGLSQTGHKVDIQIAQTDQTDSYITREMQARRIPGAAIAVIDKGKVILEKAYGTANLETDTPVKTGSVFQVASVTKQFTAAAIMMLVEEGKVRLDDHIGAYIDQAPESWANITVRRLLTHTSGIMPGAIVRVDVRGKLTTREGTPLYDITAKRALDVIAQEPLLFLAGDRAMYCDAGYFLLGLIIEKASGQSYRDFMQKRFFEPLRMTDSGILDKWKIVKNSVPVYTIRDGQLAPWRRDWQYELNSFAGLCSTVEDLAKWDAALRDGTILKKTSLDLMWAPAKLNNGQEAFVSGGPYGFGWMLGDHRGYRIAEHSGASGTHILRFLDDGLTIVVLTNLDGPSGSRPASLARGIAGLVRPAYRPPEMLAPEPDPRPESAREMRALLSGFAEGLAEGQDSPIMTAAYRAFYNSLPPPVRQEEAQLLKALKTFTYLASDNVEGRGLKRMGEPIARICYYKAELGQKVYYFTFWLTKEGKVAQLRFNPA